MELGLSLGEAPPAKSFSPACKRGLAGGAELRLGFCVGLEGDAAAENGTAPADDGTAKEDRGRRWISAAESPVQLDLLPLSPVHRMASSQALVFPWPKPANGIILPPSLSSFSL